MNNWKIGMRISAGFAAVILIAMVLGAFAYSEIGNIHKSSLEISADGLPSVYLIGQIEGNTKEILALMLQYATAEDNTERARVETQIQGVRTNTTGFLAAYEKLIHEDKERTLYAAFTANRSAFWALAEEMKK